MLTVAFDESTVFVPHYTTCTMVYFPLLVGDTTRIGKVSFTNAAVHAARGDKVGGKGFRRHDTQLSLFWFNYFALRRVNGF
jgi:hypothetical protein